LADFGESAPEIVAAAAEIGVSGEDLAESIWRSLDDDRPLATILEELCRERNST
jgi:hypothetical protein